MNLDFVKTIKKKWLMILFLLAIICISFSIFLYFNNPYKRDLKKLCSNVIAINSTCAKGIKDNIIDSKISLSTLSDNQNKLLSEKNKLDKLTLPDKYKNIQNNLKLALSNNLKLYEQLICILKNTSSKDLSKTLNSLNALYAECNKSYVKCNSLGYKVSLSNNFAIFYKNFVAYTNEVIKLNRDMDMEASEKKDFLNNFEQYVQTFNELKEDLKPAIDRAKAEKRSLNSIINDVYIKMENFNKLKQDISTISIPASALDIFNSFSNTLNKYNDYISCLSDTLNSDVSGKSPKYDNVYEKYNDMVVEFNQFQQLINNYGQ